MSRPKTKNIATLATVEEIINIDIRVKEAQPDTKSSIKSDPPSQTAEDDIAKKNKANFSG
jgi:hypothetical protein